jgi:DNA-binding MarR family transcriptional regulator
VLVLAAQNAVPYEYLGVATSGSTLFRSIGGSIGVAIFGAIFANQLATHLAASLPAGTGLPSGTSPAEIRRLPAALRDTYLSAVTESLHPIFYAGAGVSVVAFLLTFLLREVPLRATTRVSDAGRGLATATDDDGLREVQRALATLAQRDNRWALYERLATRSEIDLTPPALWLFCRLATRAPVAEAELATDLAVPLEQIQPPLRELAQRGLVARAQGSFELTPRGRAAHEQIVAARREGLATYLDGYDPDHHPELRRMLDDLAQDIVSVLPAAPAAGRG